MKSGGEPCHVLPVSSIAARSPTERPVARCEIRMLTTIGELLESYRLRYEVYSGLGYLRRLNDARLDIDEYDSSAIPFAAFDIESGEMIGTLRVVTTETQTDYDYLIRTIVAAHGDGELAKQVWGPQPHPLPSIVSESVEREIEVFNPERYAIREMSRCIVREDRRGTGISRGLTELGMAHAIALGPAVLIGGCVPEHLPMYARYGFSKLQHTELEHFDSVGQLAHTIICRTDSVPQPTQSHIESLLRAMSHGASEHTHELGRDSYALFRVVAPRRVRRRTMEWQVPL
jgi:predicted GNAT family N-acyltransferase